MRHLATLLHPTIALVALAAASVARPAAAAEITDVADAADVLVVGGMERADPFDLYITSDIEMLFANGKITREPIDRAGLVSNNCTATNPRDCLPVDELRWSRETYLAHLGLELGLFHDVALTLGWHYVLADSLQFRYAAGVDQTNSTVDPQGAADLNGDGVANADDTLFPHNFASKHKGWGNMDLGLRVAPLSDERDESKPAWVLFFKWGAPWMSTTYDPQDRASTDSPGVVGDGMHRLTFGTALSKRLGNFGLIGIDPHLGRRGYLDPYMEFSYTLPVANRSGKSKARKDNVESESNSFGRLPSHQFHMKAGVEIVPYEDLRQNRKVALDVGLRSTFYSEGRNYSELTDPLRELTYTEQFVNVSGIFGLYLQVAEFLRVKAAFTVGYNTEHFLTNEEAGKDGNGDGQVILGQAGDSANPYFCGQEGSSPGLGLDASACAAQGLPSYDQVGFRFKDEEHTVLGLNIALELTF